MAIGLDRFEEVIAEAEGLPSPQVERQKETKRATAEALVELQNKIMEIVGNGFYQDIFLENPISFLDITFTLSGIENTLGDPT